jgi:hypothetical protein
MHVSAMNGLIGIRVILGHYDAMAHKPKFRTIVGSPQTRQNGALFCDYNDIVITTLIIKLFLIEIYTEVCGGETY